MHAASRALGVHVVKVNGNDGNDGNGHVPSCQHGPTVLFERFLGNGNDNAIASSKRYYACAAYRDRKHCPAYILEEDALRGKTLSIHQRMLRACHISIVFCFLLIDMAI